MISKKEEVLRQLKLVRKAKNISYQAIVDGTEELGMAVSLSSVKRVFAEDSQACDFRYDSTLKPIVRFVMGVDGDIEEPKTYEEAKVNVEGLAAVVQLKDEMLSRAERELLRSREDHKLEIERLQAAEERKIAYLKEEIKRARDDKEYLEIRLARWRTTTILFLSLFVTSLLFVIAYLLTDHSTPEWGIFFTENPAPITVLVGAFGLAIAVSLLIASKKNKS